MTLFKRLAIINALEEKAAYHKNKAYEMARLADEYYKDDFKMEKIYSNASISAQKKWLKIQGALRHVFKSDVEQFHSECSDIEDYINDFIEKYGKDEEEKIKEYYYDSFPWDNN